MTTTESDANPREASALPALEVRGVRKTFEAELAPVRALRGVDLTVERGTFIALMGPSGCGKSTLLNLIAGLEEVDEGSIVVAGESMSEGSEDDHALIRRKHIGIVFQFFNLLEGMSVLENVALPGDHRGAKPQGGRVTRPRPARPPRHCATRRRRCPASSRVANASDSPSPGPSPTSRRCCSPTNRPAPSTRSEDKRSSNC